MTRTITVIQDLFASVSAVAEIPKGEIVSAFVKWDTLHLQYADGTEFEADLHSCFMDAIDVKRPSSFEMYEHDEDGETDYGKEITL